MRNDKRASHFLRKSSSNTDEVLDSDPLQTILNMQHKLGVEWGEISKTDEGDEEKVERKNVLRRRLFLYIICTWFFYSLFSSIAWGFHWFKSCSINVTLIDLHLLIVLNWNALIVKHFYGFSRLVRFFFFLFTSSSSSPSSSSSCSFSSSPQSFHY